MDQGVRVLVVDDQESMCMLLCECLKEQGYHADCAASGEDAVEMAKYTNYHLILMDVIMKGIDGFEACKQIKSGGRSKNAPIIFISGERGEKFETRGLDVGSIDYLTKPINVAEFISKANVHVKNSLLMHELEQYRERMQHDIQRASALYDAFLPTAKHIQEIEEKYNVQLESFFEPYNEIGGDFWKLTAIDDDKFGILCMDFSGHGVASALNVSYTRAILSHPLDWSNPIEVLSFLNQHLQDVLPAGSFATATYSVFDVKAKEVSYVNCAAPYPLLISKDASTIVYKEEGARPLGVWDSKDIGLKEITEPFGFDETFIIYSDVLLENTHQDGERWMTKGLIERIKQTGSSERKLSDIHDLFRETAAMPLMDDLTLISVRLKK